MLIYGALLAVGFVVVCQAAALFVAVLKLGYDLSHHT